MIGIQLVSDGQEPIYGRFEEKATLVELFNLTRKRKTEYKMSCVLIFKGKPLYNNYASCKLISLGFEPNKINVVTIMTVLQKRDDLIDQYKFQMDQIKNIGLTDLFENDIDMSSDVQSDESYSEYDDYEESLEDTESADDVYYTYSANMPESSFSELELEHINVTSLTDTSENPISSSFNFFEFSETTGRPLFFAEEGNTLREESLAERALLLNNNIRRTETIDLD